MAGLRIFETEEGKKGKEKKCWGLGVLRGQTLDWVRGIVYTAGGSRRWNQYRLQLVITGDGFDRPVVQKSIAYPFHNDQGSQVGFKRR